VNQPPPFDTVLASADGIVTRPWAMWFRGLLASRTTASATESSGLLAAKPTGLTAGDKGYIYEATDYKRRFRWTGSAWEYAPGERIEGEIVGSTVSLGAGWAWCNGSAVTMTRPDATTHSVTLPNLSNSYLKGAAAYSGGIVAASAAQSGAGAIGEVQHIDIIYFAKL
jgi:hypothetical protein